MNITKLAIYKKMFGGNGGGTSGATEPYIEETYDANGKFTAAVLHGHAKIRDYAFSDSYYFESITFPNCITELGQSCFNNCYKVDIPFLPEGIATIGAYAFKDCRNLKITYLPASVVNVGAFAFYGCTGLSSIKFKTKPTTFGNNCFFTCTNLTDIKVPWAEGEVAGAPWGATNATITYNYTEGA